jgi:hypothetical protein
VVFGIDVRVKLVVVAVESAFCSFRTIRLDLVENKQVKVVEADIVLGHCTERGPPSLAVAE